MATVSIGVIGDECSTVNDRMTDVVSHCQLANIVNAKSRAKLISSVADVSTYIS